MTLVLYFAEYLQSDSSSLLHAVWAFSWGDSNNLFYRWENRDKSRHKGGVQLELHSKLRSRPFGNATTMTGSVRGGKHCKAGS